MIRNSYDTNHTPTTDYTTARTPEARQESILDPHTRTDR